MPQDQSNSRERRYIAYYRISVPKKAIFGLGLEAQKKDVRRYIEANPGRLVAEFQETRSGRKSTRPVLKEALRLCRIYRAVLLVARMDRLARNVALTAALAESGQEFLAVDFPYANRFTVHVLAAVAEYESNLISERVKAAWAAARARAGGCWPGKAPRNTGGPPGSLFAARRAWNAKIEARQRDVAPIVWKQFLEGKLFGEIAEELNQQGVLTVKRRSWDKKKIGELLRQTRADFGASPEARRACKLGPIAYRRAMRLHNLGPEIRRMRAAGFSNARIAKELTDQGHLNERGRPINGEALQKLLRELEVDASGRRLAPVSKRRATDFRATYAPLVWQFAAQGMTRAEIAAELIRRKVPSSGASWSASAVERIKFVTAHEPYAQNVKTRSRSKHQKQLDRRSLTLAPLFSRLLAQGRSCGEIAETLNRRGIRTPRRRKWSRHNVEYTVHRLERRGQLDESAARARVQGVLSLRSMIRAKRVAPQILTLRRQGRSFCAIADELNRLDVLSPGKVSWEPGLVRKYYYLALSAEARNPVWRALL